MDWEAGWEDPLDRYLCSFQDLIGDRRTKVTFTETIKGILASGSTRCARIASSSPVLSKAQEGGQRVARMVTGESTTRSELDAAHLTEKLRERGIEHLAASGEKELWLISDGSELRKPHAKALPSLMKVRALDGSLVPGYRTIQVIGVTPERRGLLYHRLFSSAEPGFVSESSEIQTLLETVHAATADRFERRVWVLDSGFDDVAVFRTIWEQGEAFVCRVKEKRRKVEALDREGNRRIGSIEEAAAALRPLALAETTLEIRLPPKTPAKSTPKSPARSTPKTKRQKVQVQVSAVSVELEYDPEIRREMPSEAFASLTPSRNRGPMRREKRTEKRPLWLVEIRLVEMTLETTVEPIWLWCSEPVEEETSALRVFRMYRQRWAIEDAYGFTKECVDWEQVQLLDLKGIRTLVALAWVAAGFLYEMGVTFAWEEVQLLAKLGGFVPHRGREPGRRVLTWGLQRLLELLVTQAILTHYQAEHGSLPPNIQSFLNSRSFPPL